MSVATANADALFDVLANHRRRALLALLDEHRDGVELRTLADEIALHETREDATEGEIANAQQAVYVALYQSHAPKLEDHDIVNMEKEGPGQGGHVVEPGPEFDRALRTQRAATGDSGSVAERLRSLL